MAKKKRIGEIQLTGDDPQLWAKLQAKLFSKITELLDSPLTSQGDTVRDVGGDFIEAGINHLKERLAKAGHENAKIQAEVADLYASREKKLAEARKITAEADQITYETNRRRLVDALRLYQAVLVPGTDESVLLLAIQLEEMVKAMVGDSDADPMLPKESGAS